MVQESGSADLWLARTLRLVPVAVAKANSAGCFVGRWTSISSKLESVPPCLSDLSSHPLFARNELCVEQLQSVSVAVSEAIELAERCSGPSPHGKLQMQSDLDAVAAKLDLCVRDCRLLIKTGVLGGGGESSCTPDVSPRCGVRELLARLQIGHCEAKQRAVDGLLEALRDDESSVVALLGRSSIAALVQLLTAAAATKTREKAVTAICHLLAESGNNLESLLVSEGVLPPLIRLIESGTSAAREKAAVSLQRLSASAETARSIAGHGGIPPLVEACRTGDPISQLAAAGALKNLSGVPEITRSLVDEGAARLMVDLLDSGIVPGLKEHAAECLQNLTSCSDDGGQLRLALASEGGGIRSLVAYLDAASSPQEPAAGALSNLVDQVSVDTLMSLGVLPCLVHVLEHGSAGARQAAASAVSKVSDSSETLRRLAGALGCLPLLLGLLEAKSNATSEVAAQAIASLMACPHNRREVKRDRTSVPSLVRLLDPSPRLQNAAANEHAARCLLYMASSGRCRRMMVSYGAIGYLKKLVDAADVPGAKKLLERLERATFRNLFSKN